MTIHLHTEVEVDHGGKTGGAVTTVLPRSPGAETLSRKELTHRAQAVIDAWEAGDLAGAVRALAAEIQAQTSTGLPRKLPAATPFIEGYCYVESDYKDVPFSVSRDKALPAIQRMREQGGGFVQALAEAMLRADYDNLQTLIHAFPVIIEDYARRVAANPTPEEL